MLVFRVAVPSPLSRLFDYLPPIGAEHDKPTPGVRVSIPFGKTQRVGVLIEIATSSSIAISRLKPVNKTLELEPSLPTDLLNMAIWASQYYHHPIGEVVAAFLPVVLRQQKSPPKKASIRLWYQLSQSGKEFDFSSLKRAPVQQKILQTLQTSIGGSGRESLSQCGSSWRSAVQALLKKELLLETELKEDEGTPKAYLETPPSLNDEQAQVVKSVIADIGQFQVHLLEGVTGSGKTEVYLRLIQACLDNHQQALVLVPEIGLTPQLIDRFRKRFSVPISLLHSGISPNQRLKVCEAARNGHARIIIGTRSTIFTPFDNLGAIIVDEEHDQSLKQQDGFRYHARDLAIIRARALACPVLLGSATPALESLANAQAGRYKHLRLTKRAADASPPRIGLLDVRSRPMFEGLSENLLSTMDKHLQQKGQILLFLNRRGFAPLLMCHDCGWGADCQRCDAHMTNHHASRRLRCHHCGAERPAPVRCPECQSDKLLLIGQGTERIENAITERFPQAKTIRIDRDNTRKKGSLEALLSQAAAGEADILIGTQMLAKGHHFPKITLVGILDADRGLFGADFRATEHMAQLIVQVSGRAGRAEQKGEVLIQSHHPDNPLLSLLVQKGYAAFAAEALEERQITSLPPFSYLALLRAESTHADQPKTYLQEVLQLIKAMQISEVQAMGPAVAPMERIAGRYRWQLLLQSKNRQQLHRLLDKLRLTLETLSASRKVRWSLDIDPVSLL